MRIVKPTLLMLGLFANSAIASDQVASLQINARALVPQVIEISFEDGSNSADLDTKLDNGQWLSGTKRLNVVSPVRLTAKLASEPRMMGQMKSKDELPFSVVLNNDNGSHVTLAKANSSVDLYKGSDIGKQAVYSTSIVPSKTDVAPDLYVGNTNIVIESTI